MRRGTAECRVVLSPSFGTVPNIYTENGTIPTASLRSIKLGDNNSYQNYETQAHTKGSEFYATASDYNVDVQSRSRYRSGINYGASKIKLAD